MPASDGSRAWLTAEALLGLALVALPWCLGGAPAWTTALLLALGLGAYTAWAVGAGKHHRRWGWHPVLLLPAFGVGLAAVQLVPLPEGLLRVLCPPGAELRDFALVPLGLERWRPVSMDPPSTLRALARLVGLAGLLVPAVELGRRGAVRRRLVAVVALNGVAIALCGFLHLLAGEEALFGWYHFEGFVRLLTPFGNTNHLAAYLALAGTLALALALDSHKDTALAWSIAAGVCGVGVFLSFGRGGIAAFVATWGLVGAAALARRGGGLKAVLPWVVIGATVTVASLLAFEQLAERADTVTGLDRIHTTKVELWPMFLAGALKFWPLGLGLGAFELGFARYQTTQLTVTFTHPENLALQWLAEAGVPLSLLLLALAAVVGSRVWKGVRGTGLERYVFLALLGVVLHEVFDFALELNALGPTAVVLLGLLAGVEPRGAAAAAGPRFAVRARGLVAGLLLGGGAAAAWASGTPAHAAAEQGLRAAIASDRSPSELRAQALPAIDRHPADWVLYADVATAFARSGDPRESLAWINRVLLLRPADARIHVAAAQALLRLKRPVQALAELKAAWALGDSSSLAAGLALASREGAWDRILLPTRGHLSAVYGMLRARRQDAEARALLQVALEFPPSEEVQVEARALRARLEAELGDPSRAVELLEVLPPEEKGSTELRLVRVRLLLKAGRTEEAEAELERLQAKEPANVALGLELSGVLASLGRPLAAVDVLTRLKPFVTTPAARSSVLQREGNLWASQERWSRAIEAFRTASRIEPTRADLHYRLAELFERMGSASSALDELRQGRTLDTKEGAQSRDGWMKRLEATPGAQ